MTVRKTKKQRTGTSGITRRKFVKAAGLGAGAAALSGAFPMPAISAGRTIKFGYVSPQSGPLAPFGEADNFVISSVTKALGDGIKVGGETHPVEIIVKDSPSNPNRAADVASDLILSDEVDIMLVASTPETTNPVSDQCEVNEVPCISTVAPWQPWFFTRGGVEHQGFDWTYHFFWGLEDVIAVFLNMWGQLDTNKSVGGLFPNDGDGNAWGDPNLGFPPVLEKNGYRITDPGRYQNLTDDFSAQITAFKEADVDIVTGVVIPPDWTIFWTQAKQQGFTLKAASVGRRFYSRSPSKRWAMPATISVPRCGGARTIHSARRSPANRPPNWRTATSRRPASSGPSPSASCTRCSRWPST